MRAKTLISACLAVFFIAAVSGRAGAEEKGGGPLKKMKVVSDTNQLQNNTDDFQTALSKNVKLKDKKNGCIVVRFSADAVLSDGSSDSIASQMQIQAVIDGVPMNPGPYWFVSANDDGTSSWDQFTGDWWTCGLAGNGTKYSIEIQYRRAGGANANDIAFIGERALIIQYKR